jgi:hypothetical protein
LGGDPRGHQDQVGGHHAAVFERDADDAPVGRDPGRGGCGDDVDTQALDVAAQQGGGALVELAAQQPIGALEHGGAKAELVQRVSGFEAEQSTAGHHGPAAAVALGEGPDGERVVGRAQHERALGAESLDRRDERARPGREDEPVVVHALAGAEHHRAPLAVDSDRVGIEPRRDAALLVPGVWVEIEPLHRRAPVDQPRDAHMRL